ncbi:MAG: sterol desaturase family protein [Pseudobdellovibrio sp.]
MSLILINILFFALLLWQLLWPRRQDLLFKYESSKITRFINIKYLRFIHNLLLALFWIFAINLFTDYFWFKYYQYYDSPYLRNYFSFPKKFNWLLLILFYIIYDYANYWWHRLNHTSRFLRRYHRFHHEDFFVDISTSFRFHYVELTLQYFWTFLFALVFKISFYEITLLRLILVANGMFHHSNIRLPKYLNWLKHIIVTPEYHWNHHQSERKYVDSNYGSFLVVWDKIHKTYTKPIEENSINQI